MGICYEERNSNRETSDNKCYRILDCFDEKDYSRRQNRIETTNTSEDIYKTPLNQFSIISKNTNNQVDTDYSSISFQNEQKLKSKPQHSNKKIVINPNLKSFMENNDLEISFYEQEDLNDSVYNWLKKYEKHQLKIEFDKKSENYEKELQKIDLNLDLKTNIVSQIINNEDSEKIYKQKVIKEIISIKNDDSRYKIDYLTILLVGRKGVGKTTLINYILKLPQNIDERNNKKNEDFATYYSEKVPHLKLVEFKGIGLDNDSNPEQIGKDIIQYINDHIKKKNNNYNDFVHCIWYCITSSRFEKTEIEVLKKLKQAYKDNIMPIIVVYTCTVNDTLANKMYDYINAQSIETMFVKVLADNVELMDNTIKPTFGEKELLNKTLEKCTKSLNGEMINLMIQKISNDVKFNMLKINEEDEEKINKDIINDFVKNYKKAKKDEEFIDYIINMLVTNLQTFYKADIQKISNSSYNLINQSDIINNIKNFITNYKKKTKEIIKPIITKYAIDFIDKQANLEKINNCNILISNKRCFKGFKRTNKIYLKKNFYYISQKYIINYLIENFCRNYFSEFRKQFDIFIKNNFEKDDEEIKYYLVDCFLTKLKNFADTRNIYVVIKDNPKIFKESEMNLPNKSIINGEEELYKNEINTNSFDLGYKSNNSDNENGENKPLNSNINLDNWFPLKEKSWKYIKYVNNLLNYFLQKIDIQDSYLSQNTNDEIFKSLKEYIKNDLTNFFNSKKIDFINKINSKYNTIKIGYDKAPITEVIEGENIFSNYKEKIKNQFDIIENNNDELKIDYLTIILVGKSGAGKSALINSMILENLAEERVGNIVTKITSSYRTEEKIPFLRFIDTRGIELNDEFGPKQIIRDTHEYINNQKKFVDKNNNYNNYIQCIWYCVKDNNIEPKEIEVIKELKKDQKDLPLIIVSPNTFDKKKAEKMKNEILKYFEDIPIIPVLGKDIEGTLKNYGRDDLLNKTLEVCQKAVKGNIFNKIKMNIKEILINIFNKINIDIKKDINIRIVTKFIEEYKNVLNDQKLSEFIFDLLELNFVEYIKSYNKNETNHLSNENKQKLKKTFTISNFIENFIKFYKKTAKDIIEPILEDKELEYLDIQAKKEIKEFGKSINVENKNDKKDFKYIIETFLNNNFYYISQKYIIYRLITDVCEPYSEEVENEINNIVKDILKKEDVKNKWFEEFYYKKFEQFKKYIDTFRHNGKIYTNNISNESANVNREISSPTNNNLYETQQINYPEAPNFYPKI